MAISNGIAIGVLGVTEQITVLRIKNTRKIILAYVVITVSKFIAL